MAEDSSPIIASSIPEHSPPISAPESTSLDLKSQLNPQQTSPKIPSNLLSFGSKSDIINSPTSTSEDQNSTITNEITTFLEDSNSHPEIPTSTAQHSPKKKNIRMTPEERFEA